MVNTDNDQNINCIYCGLSISKDTRFCVQCERHQGIPCVVCSEPLVANEAKICNACGLHQNRHVRILHSLGGSTIVSAIPLLVVFAAYINEVIEPKISNLEIAATACSTSEVEIFVRNTGTKPAVIQKFASYDVLDKDSVQSSGVLSLSEKQTADSYIDGESGTLLRYFPPDVGNLAGFIKIQGVEVCSLNITLDVVEFQGKMKKKMFNCECVK